LSAGQPGLRVLSGVLISRVVLYQLGISVPGGPFWNSLHGTTAKLTLGLFPVHVALRWRWILSVARRLLSHPALGHPALSHPALCHPAPGRQRRRARRASGA
jgi:hypothetical protein